MSRGDLLGYKIILLTLLGSAAASVAAWGLTVALDSKRWGGRLYGFSLCLMFAALGVSLWSWGVYGDAGEFWRPFWNWYRLGIGQ